MQPDEDLNKCKLVVAVGLSRIVSPLQYWCERILIYGCIIQLCCVLICHLMFLGFMLIQGFLAAMSHTKPYFVSIIENCLDYPLLKCVCNVYSHTHRKTDRHTRGHAYTNKTTHTHTLVIHYNRSAWKVVTLDSVPWRNVQSLNSRFQIFCALPFIHS